jgi:hypothetical protein
MYRGPHFSKLTNIEISTEKIMHYVHKLVIAALLLLSLNSSINAQESGMLVNYGVGGGWYEPVTSGQGFSFDVIPSSNQLVAYWFTYPETGGAREWYVAQGDISGRSVDLVIYQTDNGLFDAASSVGINVVGGALLDFNGCDSATWYYEFDDTGKSGEIDLQRLGPTEFCHQFLALADANMVSRTNAWVDARGSWLFEGCVNLEGGDSHGNEVFTLTKTTATLDIDMYSGPNCSGSLSLRNLDFTMQRIDKVTATIEGGEVVIANRYLLTDTTTGQQVKQLWHVDDRGAEQRITHGNLSSPTDADGYPTVLHDLYAVRVSGPQE